MAKSSKPTRPTLTDAERASLEEALGAWEKSRLRDRGAAVPGSVWRQGAPEPHAPGWLRLRSEPPLWWLLRERERLAGLYPDLCPGEVHPLTHYGLRETGWALWTRRLTLTAMGLAVVIMVHWLMIIVAGRMLQLFAFLALIPCYYVLFYARLVVNLARARSSGFFQSLLLAGHDILPLLNIIFTQTIDRSRAFVGGGLLSGTFYFIAIDPAFAWTWSPARGITSVLAAWIAAAVMLPRTSPPGQDEEFSGAIEARRIVLGLAYYMSGLVRYLPATLVGLFCLLIPVAAFLGPIAAFYAVSGLLEMLGWGYGARTIATIVVAVFTLLALAEGATRFLRTMVTRTSIHRDVGMFP